MLCITLANGTTKNSVGIADVVGASDSVCVARACAFDGNVEIASVRDDKCDALWDIRRRTFHSATHLRVVGLRTRNIDGEAFHGCRSLEAAPIGDDTENVGVCAFRGCESLVALDVRDANSKLSIGVSCFAMCTSLAKIDIGITSVPERAFHGCTALNDANLPLLVRAGDGAFYNCPLGVRWVAPRLVHVGKECFRGTRVSRCAFPCNALAIRDKAFAGSHVQMIRLPQRDHDDEHTLSLGKRALSSTHLASLRLPGHTKLSARSCAFNTRLEWLALDEGIEDITYACFEGASRLRLLRVPASVTHVGQRAFANCTQLAIIVFHGEHTAVSPTAFVGCSALRAVYAPVGSFERVVGGIPVTTLSLGRVMSCSHTVALDIFQGIVPTADRRAVFHMLMCERRLDAAHTDVLPTMPHDVWLHVVAALVAACI